MLSLSIQMFSIQYSSVFFNVNFQLSQRLLESLLLRDENIVNEVLSSKDIFSGILDFLFKSGHITIVFICSPWVCIMDILEFFLQLIDQLVDGFY